MHKKSNVINGIKREEEAYLKSLSPTDRIKLTVSHSDSIKNLFYTGLQLKGFSKKEINHLWEENNKHG